MCRGVRDTMLLEQNGKTLGNPWSAASCQHDNSCDPNDEHHYPRRIASFDETLIGASIPHSVMWTLARLKLANGMGLFLSKPFRDCLMVLFTLPMDSGKLDSQ